MVAPPCTLKTANRIDATGGSATLLELFIRFQSSLPTQVLLLYGARILNEKGVTTGDGLSLTSDAIGSIRTRYGLKARFDRLRERGMLTIAENAYSGHRERAFRAS
jgi:hypothetical protein